MLTYPKIQTLFKRDEKTHKVIPGEIRFPEFGNIKNWLVTEKIDGTNIRVIYNQGYKFNELEFKGKTDKAQIPPFLLEELKRMFSTIAFIRAFVDASKLTNEMPQNVCLYGEGYGAGIQKGGGNYRKEVSFRLCDVLIDSWWLEWDNVVDVANKLEIKTVPNIGVMSLDDARLLVCNTEGYIVSSRVAEEENNRSDAAAEGIVARAYPMVLFRNGTPVKWKLKKKDF